MSGVDLSNIIQGFSEHSKQPAIPTQEQVAQHPLIPSLKEMQHGLMHI